MSTPMLGFLGRMEQEKLMAELRLELTQRAVDDPLEDLATIPIVAYRIRPGIIEGERMTAIRLADVGVPSAYLKWVPYREGVEVAVSESNVYPFAIIFRVPKGLRNAEPTD